MYDDPMTSAPEVTIASKGGTADGQIWASCECGWRLAPRRDLMANLAEVRAAVVSHTAQTGHHEPAGVPVSDDFHLACGVRHGLNDDCPRSPDSPAGVLFRIMGRPTTGSPERALDRMVAVQALKARLDQEEQDAVIGGRMARCTWAEMGQAVGTSRQGAWNRWGEMIHRYEAAGLLQPGDHFPGQGADEFPDLQSLSTRLGLSLTDDGDFASEADWGIYRGGGLGLFGEKDRRWLFESTYNGGWLVTLVGDGRTCWADKCLCGAKSWLVAFAIDEQDQKTGRCLLLAGPWDHVRDRRLLDEARQQPWWDSRTGGARVNVEELVSWLATADG